MIYCIAHRLAELVQFLPAHPPFERFADIGARQPKIDVVLFVGHRVLTAREPGSSRKRKELTRIMVRRAATEPKTGFTGVVFVASFMMFRPLMAIFNAGIAMPLPFRR